MAQGDVKSISNPARITAIGGDNSTEFFLNFPYFPPGSQWVYPFTNGFMYTVDHPGYTPVKIDATQTPPGKQAPITTSKVAQLAAYDTEQVFNPGILALPASTSVFQVAFQRQVNAGGIALVTAIPGLNVYVYEILISVDTPVAGAFVLITNANATQIMAQVQANTVGTWSFSLHGIQSTDGGVRLSVILANAAAGCTVVYQQQ